MTSEYVFDKAVIPKYLDMGGIDFVTQMIDLFIENVSAKMNEIKKGQADYNAPQIQNAAHSIRSSAGNFGAEAIMALTEIIEEAAKAEAWDLIHTKIEELSRLTDAVMVQLTQEKENLRK